MWDLFAAEAIITQSNKKNQGFEVDAAFKKKVSKISDRSVAVLW